MDLGHVSRQPPVLVAEREREGGREGGRESISLKREVREWKVYFF